MTRPTSFLALAVSTLLAAKASATVSFIVQADRIKDSTGSDFGSGMTFLVVASRNGDGFAPIQQGASTNVGSILSGTDDVVIYKGATSKAGSTGTDANHDFIADAFTANYSTLNIAQGDQLEIVWFPTVSANSSGALVGGTSYGAYTNLAAVDGSSAFTAPSDPTSNYTIGFYTTDARTLGPNNDGSGSSPSSAGVANLVVVPEPSSGLLATMFGGLAWAGRAWGRRRS